MDSYLPDHLSAEDVESSRRRAELARRVIQQAEGRRAAEKMWAEILRGLGDWHRGRVWR